MKLQKKLRVVCCFSLMAQGGLEGGGRRGSSSPLRSRALPTELYVAQLSAFAVGRQKVVDDFSLISEKAIQNPKP